MLQHRLRSKKVTLRQKLMKWTSPSPLPSPTSNRGDRPVTTLLLLKNRLDEFLSVHVTRLHVYRCSSFMTVYLSDSFRYNYFIIVTKPEPHHLFGSTRNLSLSRPLLRLIWVRCTHWRSQRSVETRS